MNGISETQEIVLMLTAAALFHESVNLPKSVDWDAVLRETKQQSVVPLVFSTAKMYIPPEILPRWKRCVNHILENTMRVEWEHTQLHEKMTASNIPYAVIKGVSSAAYYPEPMLRTMGDVDFLVEKANLKCTGQALEAAGFVPVEKNDSNYHIAYHRIDGNRVATWELHWELGGLPNSRAGDSIREQLSDLLSRAKLHQSGRYIVPSVFHHGMILLLHTASHMVHSGIGLRHLCDWAVFVNSLSDSEFTDMFEDALCAAGLWRFAQLLTTTAIKYLHCEKKQWAAIAEDTLSKDIIADIFASGNFGQKEPQRIYETRLMWDRQKATVVKYGFFRRFCHNVNESVHISLPVAKRYPILLPIGWVYVVVRYILRVLTGKRPKIHPNKMLQNASARKKLYAEFHLFETE